MKIPGQLSAEINNIGISVTWCAVKEPQQKAIVERAFKTLNTKLFHKMQGSIPLPPEMMRRMDYDPAKDRTVLLEELHSLLEHCVNLYHYTHHKGINDLPIRVWLSADHIPAFDQPEIVDQTMGITEIRTLTKDGVQFKNLTYSTKKNVEILLDNNADSCAKRRGTKGSATYRGKLKYNPANMGTVWFFDAQEMCYRDLVCTDREYAEGLSLWRHNAFRAAAKAQQLDFCSPQDRRDARIAMRQAIEACCPDMTARVRRQMSRQLGEDVVNSWSERVGVVAAPEGISVAPQTPAVKGRKDGGTPQKTPQRGKAKRGGKPRKSPVKDLADQIIDIHVPQPRLVSALPVSADNDGWDIDHIAAA